MFKQLRSEVPPGFGQDGEELHWHSRFLGISVQQPPESVMEVKRHELFGHKVCDFPKKHNPTVHASLRLLVYISRWRPLP